MFPQQNLKRREAAFLLSATAFRTREMQKCALPRTCTHIPSMDMRERERFASQERSDEGGIRSVAMIHRMTETEPQGFRQHNLS